MTHPWSDAWLLLAIGCRLSLEWISLAELIATADGIQHAVPTFEEVDGALARLAERGLVKLGRNQVGLTPSGLDLLTRTKSPRKPLLDWQEELGRALGAAPWSAASQPTPVRRAPALRPAISMEEYQEALRQSGRQAT
jgi:hypothetical protein